MFEKIYFKMLIAILFLGSFKSEVFAFYIVDPSDPNRLVNYYSFGFKRTNFKNGPYINELRAKVNFIVGEKEMFLLEGGVGSSSKGFSENPEMGATDSRLQWFHLFNMDYTAIGFRGVASRMDLQFAGELAGLDGQTTLNYGLTPSWGLSKEIGFFLPLYLANTWDKNFKVNNGVGFGLNPLLSYNPQEKLWPGEYFQLWLDYLYFFADDLNDVETMNLQFVTGGLITEEWWWSITLAKYFKANLRGFKSDKEDYLKKDSTISFYISNYF